MLVLTSKSGTRNLMHTILNDPTVRPNEGGSTPTEFKASREAHHQAQLIQVASGVTLWVNLFK